MAVDLAASDGVKHHIRAIRVTKRKKLDMRMKTLDMKMSKLDMRVTTLDIRKKTLDI